MERAKSKELCGADKGHGKGTCGRPAGWGTPNQTGPCKNHGGLFPTVVKHHARVQALEFARGQLGQELDIDPLEGILIAVRLSYGIVDHWRHRLASPENVLSDETRNEYQRSILDYARICDLAVKAGVAERQIKIMERAAEALSLLFEEVLAAAQATAVQREAMTVAWVQGLARLEATTIDTTATELAA